jgi:hypothetical protein
VEPVARGPGSSHPWRVRRLLARCARVRSGLPTVWEAHRRGEVDADQLQVIDRAARRAAEDATRAQIDARAVDAARTRAPQQLAAWLLRLVVECEPLQFAARHRRALSERRVTVTQGPDGTGWVTGELSATDVAQIDSLLTALARDLGPADERTEQQRRADLMADLLLGRLHLIDQSEDTDTGTADDVAAAPPGPSQDAERADEVVWVEVEDVDLETGELLGTHLEPVTTDGRPVDAADLAAAPPSGRSAGPWFGARTLRRPSTTRIGVVVPLSSLLGLTDTPAQLADRSGAVPADTLRRTIADALGSDGDEVLFTRLLTDDGGRLLDTTELGRFPSRRLSEAVALRAGTCRFPTCSVPADRCDLDHREPWPRGRTRAADLDPACRRHHRGKTFAWLAPVRDRDAVDWTLPDDRTYRCVDDPLPTGTGRHR